MRSGVVLGNEGHLIRDFMAAADILFLSDEKPPCAPMAWARQVQARYATPVVVAGLGAAGALLAVKADDYIGRLVAVYSRPVVNSIGAGDAFFSAFVHGYLQARDPCAAPRRAVVFAAYKPGKRVGPGLTADPALYRPFWTINRLTGRLA